MGNLIASHIKDFSVCARNLLPENVYNFICGGSCDEITLKRNHTIYDTISLIPRVLRKIEQVSTSLTILNHNLSSPILIAPTAYHCLLSKNGEMDTLEAANLFNTIMVLSMFSTVDYFKLCQKMKNKIWLQMYLLKDRSINENLLVEAEKLGFSAIVLTVDTPVYAKRSRELSTPLSFPDGIDFSHLSRIGIDVKKCLSSEKHFSTLLDFSISWTDIEWLSAKTSLPIIIKGIIHPEDTKIALLFPQVIGVIISNHGGRQLDSVLTSPEIIIKHKEIVGDKIKLFLDGGVDRGSDIFKALALGANSILVGRAIMWALAANGVDGVIQALSILHNELIETMILCGCKTLNDIEKELIKL